MSFDSKIKIRIVYGIMLMLLGITAIYLGVSQKTANINGFMIGFYTGTGGALIGSGSVIAISNIILLRNPEKKAEAEIEENDERNRFISREAGYITCIIMLPVLYLASIIAGFFNFAVFAALLSVTALMVAF